MSDLTIIKVGGGAGIQLTPLLDELAELIRAGQRIILVHGGSDETNRLAEQLGRPPQFITSPSGHTSRRTDRETLDIFNMAYCGKVNKRIVEVLHGRGVRAIGLSGIDGPVWHASRKSAIRAVDEKGDQFIIRDDLTGKVESVNTQVLTTLLDAGLTPVLTPPALAEGGVAVNVDADRAAARTAGAMAASELLLLSNVPGLLRDPEDRSSIITHVDADGAEAARDAAKGRMKNKVLAADEALDAGVARVVIGAANRETPIAAARAGSGTIFTRNADAAIGAAR